MPDNKGPANGAEADAAIDTRLVRKLAAILSDTGLTEIEVEKGGLRIKVARNGAPMMVAQASAPAAAAIAAPAASAMAAAPSAAPAVAAGEPVKSPMVGTAYLAAQPGADPFIKVGDKVTAGQTLCIVEAMKTMNPIPSPRAGTVVQILISDSQPVEFGEPLIILE